ncbi:MAG: hypothetical protein ABSF90_10425 [Syntrophobacteraceae bacterium]|jgi:hypothetical protein
MKISKIIILAVALLIVPCTAHALSSMWMGAQWSGIKPKQPGNLVATSCEAKNSGGCSCLTFPETVVLKEISSESTLKGPGGQVLLYLVLVTPTDGEYGEELLLITHHWSATGGQSIPRDIKLPGDGLEIPAGSYIYYWVASCSPVFFEAQTVFWVETKQGN